METERDPSPLGSGGITLTTKRNLTRWAGLFATAAMVFAACSNNTGTGGSPAASGGGAGAWTPPADLLAAHATDPADIAMVNHYLSQLESARQ